MGGMDDEAVAFAAKNIKSLSLSRVTGMWEDDELSRDIDRLGEEWRRSVTDD